MMVPTRTLRNGLRRTVPEPMSTHIRALLDAIDDNPDRDGLTDTPARVARALTELTAGRHEDPIEVLGAGFPSDADEMVVITGLHFVSLCEHHLMAFTGHATIGYLPNGRILGLSKFARCLEVLSHRLQVQERLTQQLAEAIATGSQATGVGVLIEAEHSCMSHRGIRNGALTKTSAMLGTFRTEPETRAEFLTLT